MREVVLDFETVSAVDLAEAGAWRYAADPTTDVLCASVTVKGGRDAGSWLWLPRDQGNDALWLRGYAADLETIFVAHNAGFEKAIWREIMVKVHGFPDIPNSRWHDTMAVCAMRRIPLDLDSAARVLQLPQQKDTEGSKITVGLSKFNKKGYYDRSPEKLQKVYDYCMQDSATEVALLDEVGYLPPGERDVWLLDQRINERGVRVDLDFVRASQHVIAGSFGPLLQEFSDMTGGLRPTQRDRVMDWVEANGYWLPDLKKETLARVLGTLEAEEVSDDPEGTLPELPPMPGTVARALRVRSLLSSSSIKKLSRMEACAGLDGRVRGVLQYHAAGTGRWGGRLLQPQNFPRGVVKVGGKPMEPDVAVGAIMTGDHEYVSAILGEPVEVVASSLRHALVAGRGRSYVAGDFSGIEARVVLALAGQHDKTALMASGKDVYLDMADDIYRKPKGTLTKADIAERTIGKNTVLGCGFQMGAKTFRLRYCPDRSEEFAAGVISAYRQVWAPEVPKLWAAQENAALLTVMTGRPHEAYGVEWAIDGRWMTARLPSGRKLWYFNPRKTRATMPWSTLEKPDIRDAWTFQTTKTGKWVTISAYGGILTENIVQALARDLLVHAMFKAEANGLPIVLTVHDEIVAEPLAKDADYATLKQIMEDSPAWARSMKVPVQIEGWVDDRYRK